MAPFTPEEARAWWGGVIAGVGAGATVLFGGFIGGDLVGTVQLVPADKPNQPHRRVVRSLLVNPGGGDGAAGKRPMGAWEGGRGGAGLPLPRPTTPAARAERL